MPAFDPSVINDRSRVAAAEWAGRTMPSQAIPLDGIASLVARLLRAPIGAVSVVSGDSDLCVGAHGLPVPLTRHVPMHYSVCKYVVSVDHPLAVPDMGADPDLHDHPARREFGVAAFAGVPLRDDADRPVGALTVVDYVPRAWSETDLAILVDVATLIGPVPEPENGSELKLLRHDPVDGADGSVSHAVVQAEVQQRFIAALLDSLQVGVLALDAAGEPVLFNRTLRRVYGIGDDVPLPEAAVRAQRLLRHPDGRRKTFEETAVRRALGGEPVRDAASVVRVAGQPERALLTNSEPIHAEDGRLLGAVSTVLDVTETRRAAQFRDAELAVASMLNKASAIEEAAPAVVGLLGSLLRSAYVALWLVNPQADALVMVTHWTAPGVTMDDIMPPYITRDDSGPGRVWATGQPLFIPDLASSPDHATGPAHAFAQGCLARGLRTAVALPIRDGEQVLGVLTCLSNSADGETPHLAGLVGGIAGQIGAFLTRRRAAELAVQLNRAKNDFIALVGHAVRTPLTSITAYTELVCQDPQLPDELREMLDVVRRNNETLRRIVVDLLDLGALETGEDALHLTDVDLVALIRDAVEAAAPAAEAAGTTLQTRLPGPLHLHADGRRLGQLLNNLIDNAVTFSPGGLVQLSLERTGPFVELRVADNGVGIPPDQRDRVFDRFFRADVAHTDTTGTGLGLTLVRAVAQAHGGSVRIGEHAGPGTTVVVRLPCATRNRTP